MSLPEVITDRAALRQRMERLRSEGRSIGFVPTMGALHAGHLSLVEASNGACDATIVSIFVNPTQFGPHEDLAKYPRTLQADLEALSSRKVEAVYAPPSDEVYRSGHETYVEVGAVARRWEGAVRPGHFRGVATVVLKLLNLVQPHVVFFGQKDYQQCRVVQQLVDDFDLPVEIRVCPIVREADGLALSSRNIYLSPTERVAARSLSQALRAAETEAASGNHDVSALIARMSAELHAATGVSIDYVAVVDRQTLEPLERLDRPAVALIAARLGATRLIDNALL